MKEALLLFKRGDYVESFHRIHLVVVDSRGEVVFKKGKEDLLTCMRSSAKPFQAIPLVLENLDQVYNLTANELAIFSGSINGEDFQVETVRRILSKAGLDESYLKCGPAYPSYKKYAEKLKSEGVKPAPIYHNCAGKHAGMLIYCKAKGLDIHSYYKQDHPLQKEILKIVSEYSEVEDKDIKVVTDGCGLPVYFMPLKNIAIAYKNLALRFNMQESRVKKLIGAVIKHPEMIGGTDRLCTDLIRATEGRVFVKVGAEALYAGFNVKTKEAFVFKVEDGGQRALNIFLLMLLKRLDWLYTNETEKLNKYLNLSVKNSRNDVVGKIEAVI
ncbi:MAG: asparaginase [Proteobacteria bacterium]|nr:asparaginase [Pseudomonadota bacterium]